jgi:hypothetical protein
MRLKLRRQTETVPVRHQDHDRDLHHSLMTGCETRPYRLDGQAEYAKAWRLHREALIAEAAAQRPFHRPDAYWTFEIGDCTVGLEDEESALVRLGLPLTAEEMAIVSEKAGRQK